MKYEGATLKLGPTPGHYDLSVTVGLWGHCAEREDRRVFFLIYGTGVGMRRAREKADLT